MSFVVEAVGKVPKQVLGLDAEKGELLECATINDLMVAKGQLTPENIVLTHQKDFFYRLVTFFQPEIFNPYYCQITTLCRCNFGEGCRDWTCVLSLEI